MMKTHAKKNKHLTLQDRIEIQGCLDKGMTFKAIAHRVQKEQTTVSKEERSISSDGPTGKARAAPPLKKNHALSLDKRPSFAILASGDIIAARHGIFM